MDPARPCGPILVVDDDDALREYVMHVLDSVGYTVVGAARGDEALDVAESARLEGAVVDVLLPVVNGYEVCRALKERHPGLPVILVSGERIESFDRVAGLLIGADDYVVKPFAADELVARLRGVMGRRPVRRSLRGLTPRELEVLAQLAEGLDQAAIAARLVISPKTVATHIERILAKLDVHTRAQAVAAAYRERLLEIA